MPEPWSPIGPGQAEMTDTAFLFEPHPRKTLPDRSASTPPRSLFTYRIPPPPLAAFVGTLWFYRCDASVRVPERVLPTGSMELVVDLRDDARGP
jgi:hypothetical protein